MIVTSSLIVAGSTALFELFSRADSQNQAYQLPVTQGPSSSSSTQTSQVLAPPGYVLIGPSSSLVGRTSAYFMHPTQGSSILVMVNGTWKAFSSTCTHLPCTVQYGGGPAITCPCHGATFSTNNGSVLGGPAPAALPEYGVLILDGDLYVSESVTN